MLMDDIETHLLTTNLLDGYTLYVDGFRDRPNLAICLYEYGSNNGPKGIVSNTRQIQVAVRAEDIVTARMKAEELHTHFDAMEQDRVLLTEDRWATFFVRGTPVKLKEDDEGRFIYVFNMSCTTPKL